MNKELLLANLRSIPDFPIPGILFRDVTTLFKSHECLKELEDVLYEMYKDKGITKVWVSSHVVLLWVQAWQSAWVRASYWRASRESFLLKPSKRVTRKSMALTP